VRAAPAAAGDDEGNRRVLSERTRRASVDASVEATLTADGDQTILVIEVQGMPADKIAFYGRSTPKTSAPTSPAGSPAMSRRIAARFDGATVVPLRKSTQRGVAPFVLLGTRVFAPLDLMSPSPEEGKNSRSALYIATPAVLRYLGIDPATIAAGADFR